jgi:dTDP-4-dehydro-6-deoxy-alpha-D-glucopyranose 2,3-dehydratase
MRENEKLMMLKSALALDTAVHSMEEIFAWIEARRQATRYEVKPIPFSALKGWRFDPQTGNLHHESGRFFSIEGVRVRTDWGFVPEWDQPIICQPEVGFLGILCKKINGVLHFLLQTKIEPGNIGGIQIAPTLQATKSNYTQVHKGARPRYLEYFISPDDSKVHLDVLQSEQGSKYLRKRNRNIILEVDGDIPVEEDFCWMTLGQIGLLLKQDNLINMDTRTVISCISYGSYDRRSLELAKSVLFHDAAQANDQRHMLLSALDAERHLHTLAELISWITHMKCRYELEINRIPLNEVRCWQRDSTHIRHETGKYFSVMAVEATIESREVSSWCQPLVQSAQIGIIAFLIKEIKGVYHFLVQAKLEPGNMDIIELAPTVQCVNDNYRSSIPEQKPAYLDYVLQVKPEQIWCDTHQSEEGGRFYHEQNRSLIIEVEDDFPLDVPPTYAWMTLNQIKMFIHFNNYFNMEARSLVSAIGLW